MNWVKTGRRVIVGGGTTVTYTAAGTGWSVESRRRPVPHANRSSTWDYTSYFVMKDGADVAEKHSLRDAQAYAEVRHANEELRKEEKNAEDA